jgi:F-type H+-transporting ATPase subunit epsilon
VQVVLATVARKVLDTPCYSVVLPTVEGQIEVLEGHVGLLTLLATGVMRVKKTAEAIGEKLVIQSGFAQVMNNQLYVITEVAEQPADINGETAKAATLQLRQELERGNLTSEQAQQKHQQLKLNQARLDCLSSSSAS